jgi:hypothetical protein
MGDEEAELWIGVPIKTWADVRKVHSDLGVPFTMDVKPGKRYDAEEIPSIKKEIVLHGHVQTVRIDFKQMDFNVNFPDNGHCGFHAGVNVSSPLVKNTGCHPTIIDMNDLVDLFGAIKKIWPSADLLLCLTGVGA